MAPLTFPNEKQMVSREGSGPAAGRGGGSGGLGVLGGGVKEQPGGLGGLRPHVRDRQGGGEKKPQVSSAVGF